MQRPALCLLLAAVACSAVADDASSPQVPYTPASFARDVVPFLSTYCTDCHGESTQEAERRFDQLALPIESDEQLFTLQDILDQVSLGEMPPSDATQPSRAEKAALLESLRGAVSQYHQRRQSTGGETVLRRLNRRDYLNTIGDLLGIDTTIFDPTVGFPKDAEAENFNNIGDALVTSGYLLDQYLGAADAAVEKALAQAEKFEPQEFVFDGPFEQQNEIDRARKRIDALDYLMLLEMPLSEKLTGAYAALEDFREGVPHDGFYEVRFQAQGVNRQHPYDSDLVTTDPTQPMVVGVVPGNAELGKLYHSQPIEPLLASVPITDELEWYSTKVWLDQGFSPRFTYRNGPIDSRPVRSRLSRRIVAERPELKGQEKGDVGTYVSLRYGQLPQIHIHEVRIRGPLQQAGPTPARRALFGDLEPTEANARAILERFATRAYRRPTTEDEADRLMDVFAVRLAAGHAAHAAIGDAMKAALCSPAFLYLAPVRTESSDAVDPLALASRLSYFLWCTMPDESLMAVALDGSLRDPAVMRHQALRMLKDRRSDAFIAAWLDNWLTLRQLGGMPPDRNAFRQYYAGDLRRAMREETELFVRTLVDENHSVMTLLDADFTYLNKPLADLYGIEGVDGLQMQRVSLDDARRGGLLGHASLLTVTANGIDTSPVVRGVWLLENLLASPPSPPPNDVEPLDPDTRGAETIREQLTKHRGNPSCYDCHRRIDPLGFALENFDPIGRWRDFYGKSAKIDARGELPDGSSFEDVVGLKKIFAARREQFTRAVTEKLLMQALGRRVERLDRPDVDAILDRLEKERGGMRDLIILVCQSEIFQKK